MSWRPTAALDTLRLRAGLKQRARRFFADRGLLEVDTPALSAAGATDPAIASLSTRPAVSSGQQRWLHTSPEFPMKRLLAAGSGDIWQMCTVFRDGEAGRRHNPEFTMVEWYRMGWDHHRMADETVAFVADLLSGAMSPGDAASLSYRDAFRTHAHIDPFQADTTELTEALIRSGVSLPSGAMSHDALLDLLMGAVVAPALGKGTERAVVLHGYPPDQAALARVAPGPPPVAERFELFVDGMEIANGFHELCDAAEQRRRFESDAAKRERDGLQPIAMDERLLDALTHGLAPCAGVAVGFDRLMMLAAGAESIDQVLAFPYDIA